MNETMAKASVGIMKMRPAVTTAERSPALASHASPHPKPDSLQVSRQDTLSASIAASVVMYQMMSHAEPAAWQIAPRIDITIAATCRHAPLPGSFGPQQQSIEPAIVANRPPTAERAWRAQREADERDDPKAEDGAADALRRGHLFRGVGRRAAHR